MCIVKPFGSVYRAAYLNLKSNPMNHYDNYLETKTILGLSDNYYTGVQEQMRIDDPEYTAKQDALSRLIQRKPKKGRGVGSNAMEKF